MTGPLAFSPRCPNVGSIEEAMRPISPGDVQKMRDNGYDPLTIREAEASLRFFERGAVIVGRIQSAFAGVTLGDGVGLQESRGADDYEDKETLAKYRAGDEKDDWRKIPVSELNCACGGLCFFDAEGMRFHLPAYLIAELRGEYHFHMAFNLTHLNDHTLRQFELLNGEQRECVRDFLIHLLDDRDYQFEREAIQNALIDYWMK